MKLKDQFTKEQFAQLQAYLNQYFIYQSSESTLEALMKHIKLMEEKPYYFGDKYQEMYEKMLERYNGEAKAVYANYAEARVESLKIMTRIEAVISLAENPHYIELLRRRYILCEEWDVLAKGMKISRASAFRYHKDALAVILASGVDIASLNVTNCGGD